MINYCFSSVFPFFPPSFIPLLPPTIITSFLSFSFFLPASLLMSFLPFILPSILPFNLFISAFLSHAIPFHLLLYPVFLSYPSFLPSFFIFPVFHPQFHISSYHSFLSSSSFIIPCILVSTLLLLINTKIMLSIHKLMGIIFCKHIGPPKKCNYFCSLENKQGVIIPKQTKHRALIKRNFWSKRQIFII